MATPEVMGPYVIYERLGAGGMATVHRAEQIGLAGFRKQVALKRLLPHIADDPKMLKMFTHEARLASHLRHGNVAQIYDLGKHEDTYFIAMEYVAGPTLTDIMQQSEETHAMPVGIVLAILGQICDALDHAHNLCDDGGRPLGIIHRDVSPGNIIVSSTGVVKLIDFGIAKVADAGEVQTQAGYIKGKYAYIAPEYTLGHLDLRADLFGLGVIAHEMLAARRLFHASTDFETIMRLREMPIQPPSRWNAKVPSDVDDIVMTALQRDPALRWQTAAAMRAAIHNAARTTDNIVTSSQLAEWVESSRRKRPHSPDSTSGSSELTTHQQIELEALGAVTEASQATLDTDPDDFDTIDHAPPKRKRATTRSLQKPKAREFANEAPTTVASPAYIEAVARATPSPRTSAHVIRRDTETGEVKTEPRPSRPILPSKQPAPIAAESPPAPSPSPAPAPSSPPPPLPETAADVPATTEAARAQLAASTFPVHEDSGVVVSAATRTATEPAAPTRRRVWPWIVLALVVLALGAAWYLYFIEGWVPDLDAL